MTLDETVSNDITCLYAAKNISQYVVLKQPEPIKGITAILAMKGILETKCKTAIQDIGLLLEKDDEEGDSPGYEKALNKLVARTYKQIKAEVSDLYKKLKASGLPKDDEERFETFLKGFKNEDFQMMMYGLGQQEVRESPNETANLGKKADEAHANYLASAGINTEEGKIAWTIVYHAGLMFRRATDPPWKEDNMPKNTIKLSQTTLGSYIRSAINDGLRFDALIEDREKLRATSVSWLSNEIKDRLSKGLEFNLLDSVFVWMGKDNDVYMRLDRRKLYTI